MRHVPENPTKYNMTEIGSAGTESAHSWWVTEVEHHEIADVRMRRREKANAAVAALFGAALLLLPCIGALAGPGEQPLVCTYVVVAMRAASAVAAPRSSRKADTRSTRIGTELRVGNNVSWYRERCELRDGPAEGSAALVERNLADLQIAPASMDSRLNRNLIIDCLGRSASDVWEVLV